MSNLNIAIISGGHSSKIEKSLRTANMLKQLITEHDMNASIIHINENSWILENEVFKDVHVNKDDFTVNVNNYARTEFDCVVIAIHGTPAEDGKLAAYFELINKPYISSGVFASTLSYNKFHCNQLLKSQGILVPESLLYSKRDIIRPGFIASQLTYPLFVKPNSGVLKQGITKVQGSANLQIAADLAFQESESIIIEEAIDGMELNCGLLKTSEKEIVLPISEIRYAGDFFDYKSSKESSKKQQITPAVLSEDVEAECKMLSSKIYDLLNCYGLVNINYILKDEKIYFIDINTIPDMSEDSVVTEQAKAMNLTLSEIIKYLIEDAISKKK